MPLISMLPPAILRTKFEPSEIWHIFSPYDENTIIFISHLDYPILQGSQLVVKGALIVGRI
jgi:hypothetical protein